MTKELTKEAADKLMLMEGEARGLVIKSDWDYLSAHYGEEGVKKVEDRMAELGHPFPYKEIRNMRFYPIGFDILSMLVIREELNFDDEEMVKMGAFGPTTSIILKVLMRYFLSVENVLANTSNIWRKHYTIGDVKKKKLDLEKGETVLELSDFKTHPIHCLVIKGYLGKVLEMIINKPTEIEESKCAFDDGANHEFTVTWDA